MTGHLQSDYFKAGHTKLCLITPEAQLRTCQILVISYREYIPAIY